METIFDAGCFHFQKFFFPIFGGITGVLKFAHNGENGTAVAQKVAIGDGDGMAVWRKACRGERNGSGDGEGVSGVDGEQSSARKLIGMREVDAEFRE